jgi:hypothetical protein
MGDTVLAETEIASPLGYNVSGDNIVWSSSRQPGLRLYNISTRTSRNVGTSMSSGPLIAGKNIVWTIPPEFNTGEGHSAIQMYNIDTGLTKEILSSAVVRLHARATVGGTMLAYTTLDDEGVVRLWLTPLN